MPLDITQVVDGNSPIPAESVTQFYRLLTGTMTDQPVTLKNRVAIGGNQAASDNTLTLVGVAAQTGYQQRSLKAVGDVHPTFGWDVNGKLSWGAGGASAPNTTLERFVNGGLLASQQIVMAQAATQAPPGPGLTALYSKSDGLFYLRSGAAGAETAIGGTNVTDPLVAQEFC